MEDEKQVITAEDLERKFEEIDEILRKGEVNYRNFSYWEKHRIEMPIWSQTITEFVLTKYEQ